jgi:hypothetical protein
VTIAATGFGEGRKEAVKVGEAATATVDFKLEIAAVEATVSVAAGQLKANTDPVYQTLRQQTRGWTKLGMATMVGNSSVDVTDIKLPSTPKRVAICALNDVLAASIQNGK